MPTLATSEWFVLIIAQVYKYLLSSKHPDMLWSKNDSVLMEPFCLFVVYHVELIESAQFPIPMHLICKVGEAWGKSMQTNLISLD